jgi:hypothetical protein
MTLLSSQLEINCMSKMTASVERIQDYIMNFAGVGDSDRIESDSYGMNQPLLNSDGQKVIIITLALSDDFLNFDKLKKALIESLDCI